MANYIKEIRALVGHKPIFLNCAGGILLNDQQQVLLNLRTDTHNWSLPGGYLEYGESFAEACVREYKEDSGIDVKVVAPIGLFDRGETVYPNGDVTQTIAELFLVEAVGGHQLEQATDETLKLAYFDLDNLPPLLNQQTADMLAATAEYLKDHTTHF
ncbi:NUDIX hydrolase [Lactiplantibacillus fabifermentans]|uniref:NTP pyrophosphohydrolase n=2 Tax=Lactiplantibacillus fabifermentans TaxID=483011 RepID=A0A0R2NT18_9LACO|nr:NUDIX hydrolase [Lactiplantibacillus fabifermentans]ETY75678.1 ADP-ribose pyrophosphatase [Lactiplantibacillus fabifermentans T30PCM01]KRO28806.1 NTP pyrophosphohydrolase [Lactiplantibacillus fabifermentans DSM 21115]